MVTLKSVDDIRSHLKHMANVKFTPDGRVVLPDGVSRANAYEQSHKVLANINHSIHVMSANDVKKGANTDYVKSLKEHVRHANRNINGQGVRLAIRLNAKSTTAEGLTDEEKEQHTRLTANLTEFRKNSRDLQKHLDRHRYLIKLQRLHNSLLLMPA